MPKSLLYVPGLALDPLPAAAATTQAFKDKVERTFRFLTEGARADEADAYMVEMVDTLCSKGAVPVDCGHALRWVQISGMKPARGDAEPVPERKPADVGKAMSLLGSRADNLLSKVEGSLPKPVVTVIAGSGDATPCRAAEFLAQPRASALAGAPAPLAAIARHDTLYIAGHSNAGGGSLTYKYPARSHVTYSYLAPKGCDAVMHFEKRHIDPVTLASLLIDEGLPAGLEFDIAVVACFSGGLDNEQLQTVQSYAQRLSGSLAARGYRCRVYGAKGLTSSAEVSGQREVHVASTVTPGAGGRLVVDAKRAEALADAGSEPFYRRFFRAFG